MRVGVEYFKIAERSGFLQHIYLPPAENVSHMSYEIWHMTWRLLYSELFGMPTIFTHGAIGFTAMRPTFGAAPDRRLLFASILLPILPDADALLTPWIPYAHPFGHRGFTHSLFFAALVRSEEHTSELQSRPHLVC